MGEEEGMFWWMGREPCSTVVPAVSVALNDHGLVIFFSVEVQKVFIHSLHTWQHLVCGFYSFTPHRTSHGTNAVRVPTFVEVLFW